MLQFCNERVTEDCVGNHHCPRWKTNKWRGYCEEKLGSHFPFKPPERRYCTDYPLDPACECLAGEYGVDPNASFVEATDAIPCGEPRVCKDADGKEVPGIYAGSPRCGKC